MRTHTTYSAKAKDIKRKWYLVDATDKTLGRLSVKVASILKGKHKPEFTPHVDTGDFVIVINAEKVKLTGNKWNDKRYFRHSGAIGGWKAPTAKEILDRHPERLVQYAVRGMIPKTKLGNKIIKKLKVYVGEKHPHEAQKTVPLKMSPRVG